MENFSLKILELTWGKENLNIAVRVKGPYDPAVKEPKIAIIFDNGKENRRLPLLQQTYYPEKDLEGFVIFAKYTYLLRHLFFNQPLNEEITFWFEFTYGDLVIDKVPFYVSGDVQLEPTGQFEILFSENMDACTLKVCDPGLIVPPIKKNTRKKIRNFADGVWTFFLCILVVALLPLFVTEAILSYFGLVKRIKKNTKKGLLYPINHVRLRISTFIRKGFGITDAKKWLLQYSYHLGSLTKVKQNRIVFLSNRRTDLTGNFQFVYDILKQDPKLDMRFVLDVRGLKKISFSNIFRFGYYCATSKVILVDDYVSQLFEIPRREGTTLIQLWHACGAFKTFGYSRLGKPGGQKQRGLSHRNYDYCIVSSQEIAKFYAEGFGISSEKPQATGIPRTDIFFDAEYKRNVTEKFYEQYPKLKNKKILLFAPTFRGNGKNSGYYPVGKFDVVKMYEELGGEYAIIIKHHPFVRNRNQIPEEYQDMIIDLSNNSELNDLLFVADLLITDYSSVIFEAALLDVPMLFFAFDLQRYVADRGFYYEYEEFVPGKIVSSFGQAVTAIRKQDFETDRIERFKTRFFDDLDGKSSQRVVDLIYRSMNE